MRVAIQFFKDKYRSYYSLPARKRMAINVAIALLFLFCAFLSGKTTLKMVRASALRCVIYAFSSPALILKTLSLFIFFLIFIIILTGERSVVNPVESTDNRGVDFLKYGTMGTGNFMSYEEAQEAFTICDIKDTKELILGQFSEGGKEVVAFKDLPNGGNRNVFILGSAGTGKSLVLLKTVEKLIDETKNSEYKPSITFVTFTTSLVKYNSYVAKLMKMGIPEENIKTADSFFKEILDFIIPKHYVNYSEQYVLNYKKIISDIISKYFCNFLLCNNS